MRELSYNVIVCILYFLDFIAISLFIAEVWEGCREKKTCVIYFEFLPFNCDLLDLQYVLMSSFWYWKTSNNVY